MSERDPEMRIAVTPDGPYLVKGGVPLVRTTILTNDAGESVAWEEGERLECGERYALCRCGHSGRKPMCDGSHLDMGFDGTETAGHDSYAELSVSIDGPGVRLHDARTLCAEARFCDRAEGLWNLVEACGDEEKRRLAEEEAMLCPSGRYVMCDESGAESEPEFEPSIALVHDPAAGCSGPIWVRGRIPVYDAEGVPYETRNRVTLCRCGGSANKPFCDGTHVERRFAE